jgi:hypothetical protein
MTSLRRPGLDRDYWTLRVNAFGIEKFSATAWGESEAAKDFHKQSLSELAKKLLGRNKREYIALFVDVNHKC